MGVRTEQTFFPKRKCRWPKAYGKILNIANHWGNENQNHDLISPQNYQKVYRQKEHK